MTTFSDPILNDLQQRVVAQKGDLPQLLPTPPEQYFESLCESIVSQQLSVKVADVIFNRLKNVSSKTFSPEYILDTDHESLRSVGLSNAKASYIRNIADAWTNGLIKPAELATMNDEAVIDHLVRIKGVGRWTAEMFLIFTLARPDIFSAGDYGLKKAISINYEIDITSKPHVFTALAEQWSPQRSLASRILWKSLELK